MNISNLPHAPLQYDSWAPGMCQSPAREHGITGSIMTDSHAEAEIADVVVVGGGGSGLAAAVSAANRGMRTVVSHKARRVFGVST